MPKAHPLSYENASPGGALSAGAKKNLHIIASALILLLLVAALFAVHLYGQSMIELAKESAAAEQANLPKDSFSVALIPDIQNYSAEGKQDILFQQMEWIVSNRERLNIVFAAFEGDIVNDFGSVRQWEDANKAVSILEGGGIPFLLVPGNHDHENNDPSSPAKAFNRYFPSSRFSDGNSWGGSIQGNNSSYYEVGAGGKEFVFLGLDFCPGEDELAWANDVFSANGEKDLVLVTHAYLNAQGERRAGNCQDTDYIWNGLVRRHKNLRIVIAGHMHGESLLVSSNDYNVPVYQMLADYQEYPNGGNGYLRVLTFVPDRNAIEVRTYSPYLDSYRTGPESSFDLNYPFE